MNIRMRLKKYEFLVYLSDLFKKIYYKYLISDKRLINKKFNQYLGRDVNLTSPEKFNDKLQWLKLYWYDPLATKCADKYEARGYVREKIGGNYLNELLGVYNKVEEINLKELPKSFVLKATHGSGCNIICKDKYKVNWQKEFKTMKRWLRLNHYWSNREWVYKDIKPRIICERYIEDETGKPPMDYKIFCFHGEPKLIQVDIDRFGVHKSNFFDVDWNFKNIEIENPSDRNIIIERPKNLEVMLDLSRILSKRFPHVRVDLYNTNDKILFGELTFFHHSGFGRFRTIEFEKEMGSYLKLPLR